jgi:hypothetical protein
MIGFTPSRLAVALGLAACAACSSPAGSTRAEPTSQAASAAAQTGLALLELNYQKPATVGGSVRATATGLPPGRSVALSWGTVSGGWVIEDYYHFRGKKYTETTTGLGEFKVDAGGRLDAQFTIPEDFGGVHEVTALIDGRPVAQNGINVTQTFTLATTSGPVGTPLELKVTGLGWRTMESTWVVNWDNREVGFVSAAGTRGSAVARFRAAGPVGDHTIKLYTGWQGQAYLNYEQSPNCRGPSSRSVRQPAAPVPLHMPNRTRHSRCRRLTSESPARRWCCNPLRDPAGPAPC